MLGWEGEKCGVGWNDLEHETFVVCTFEAIQAQLFVGQIHCGAAMAASSSSGAPQPVPAGSVSASAVAAWKSQFDNTAVAACPAVAGNTTADAAVAGNTTADDNASVHGSTVAGDSSVAQSDNEEDPAVADDADAEPRSKQVSSRKPRETRPVLDPTMKPETRQKWQNRNDQPGVGNVGFLFGNWGQLPKNKNMRSGVEMMLKNHPAQIIGLAECSWDQEKLLRANLILGDPQLREEAKTTQLRGMDELKARDGYEYLTIRGQEASSLLVGVRTNHGNGLELLDWERRREGEYKRRSRNSGKAVAYSRSMIVKVTLENGVGFWGNQTIVMVMHLHNHIANGKWPGKLTEFWDWLASKLTRHEVQVLMGDFNMSLFNLVPQLRSRGITIDTAAWYPWRNADGEPMADSCGIFFVNSPGRYKLYKSIDDVHDNDNFGILWMDTAVAGKRGRMVSIIIPGTEGQANHLIAICQNKKS